MNTTTNTDLNTHKTFCYLLLFTASAISLYLTASFMYELGSGAGMAVVFSLVGVVFDVAKSHSPTLATKVVSKSQPTALLLGVLSLSLICVSGAASVFSLQSGVDHILSESKAAKVAQLKVDSIQSEIEGLEKLRNTQLSIDHVSKANDTTLLMSQKRKELNAAIDASMNSTDNNLLYKFSTELVYIVSIGLELISVAMTMVLFHLNTSQTAPNNIRQDQTQPPSSAVVAGLEAQTAPIIKQAQTNALPEVVFQASVVRSQVKQNLKAAIVSGQVKPQHREIWDFFKGTGMLKQHQIREYLEELIAENVLYKKPNGSCGLVTA